MGLVVAAVVGSLAVAAGLGSSGASSAPLVSGTLKAAGPAITVPKQVASNQASDLGPAAASQKIRLVLGLTRPHAAEEKAFLATLQDRSSPNYHKYLTAAQWNARFSPSTASEQKVVAWAKAQGLTVTQRYANRLLVDVSGNVATIDKALGVAVENYQLGAKSFYSNKASVALPSAISSLVTSVGGLNSLQSLSPNNPQARSNFKPYSAGPAKAAAGSGHANGSLAALKTALAKSKAKAKAKAKATPKSGVQPATTSGFYDPSDIYNSQAYDVDTLNTYRRCCNPTHAANVTPPATSIAISTVGTHAGSDFSGFQSQYPYLAYHYQEYYIDGTPSGGDLEGTMDLEWATAMANSFGSYIDTAMVYLYSGANAQTSTFTDIWNQMLSDGHARTMSTSWGCAESYCYDTGTMNTDDGIFNSMVGQGWTLVGASDDKGAYADCSHVSVEFPPSDPNMVSAGGTDLQAVGSFSSETAWIGSTSSGSCASNGGGGGGGCSTYFSLPSWQSGKINGVCSSGRAEPDVSLNAGIGQNIYYGGTLRASGGTSIVAPELSGIFAQTNSWLGALGNVCSGSTACPTIGNPLPHIYISNSARHNPFYDITSGCTTNDAGGGYCAIAGYDRATGLGSINVYQFVRALAYWAVPEATAPSVAFSGPGSGYHNGGTISWTVTDGGSPATGVEGYTAQWGSDPGDPTTEPHGGSGNPFYSGPASKLSTTGSATVASGGTGCNTLYVRSWDNIGDSSVYSYPSCYDATAPTITSSVSNKLLTGQESSFNPRVQTSWVATDATSGINGYYVYRSTDGGSYTSLGYQTANSIIEYLPTHHHYRYEIYARDNAGNNSAPKTSANFYLHEAEDTDSSLIYSGGWGSQSLSGASGGSVKYTKVAGKTVKFTFTGTRFAWISSYGTDRGSATVSVDGGTAQTVNTNRSVTTRADAVFAGSYASGTHTVTITNLATSGKPRIDMDAVVWIS
ncbi:protease pro-enzyme activation domain-containing protein [uncultured Jatrophihabitans sp.]|uniref:S53 family peptidase n=1 Tax=uncultured Jatrophihabitans sp. TaxID=1610747 RepID=UPI0035C9B813